MARAHNQIRGSAHPLAKLTEHDVRLILQLAAERRQLLDAASRLSTTRLAEKFDVAPSTIERIIYGERWGHV